MAEKRQFSSEYVQARRILLASSALLCLISTPGVKLDKLPILGLELTGVSPLWVWIGLIVATVYFFFQYWVSISEELSVYKDVLDSEDNALTNLPSSLGRIENHISGMRHFQEESAGRATIDRLAKAFFKRDAILDINQFRSVFATRLAETIVAMLPTLTSSAPHTPPQLGTPEYNQRAQLSLMFKTVIENYFKDYVEKAAELVEEPGSQLAFDRESLATLSRLAAGQIGIAADEFNEARREIASIHRRLATQVFWRRARIKVLEIAIPVTSAVGAVGYSMYHLVHSI